MIGARRDVAADPAARAAYVEGVHRLQDEHSGASTADLGLPGPATDLRTWDLLVAWHHLAATPAPAPGRAARRGPADLAWNRVALLVLERQLRRVLDDPGFALPYWDWAADGDLEPAAQPRAAVWGPGGLGDDGAVGGWRVRVAVDATGHLGHVDRPLRRTRGVAAPRLPTTARLEAALALRAFDAVPPSAWATHGGAAGFRPTLEGWLPTSTGPHLRALVHVWVGGDLRTSTAANDPVRHLADANVDRIWRAWERRHPASASPSAVGVDEVLAHPVDAAVVDVLGGRPTTEELAAAADAYDHLPGLIPA